MSLRGKIITKIVGSTNVNPSLNNKIVETIRNLDKMNSYKVPKGYSLERKQFNGVWVEVMSKNGMETGKTIYMLHGGAYISRLNDLYRNFAKFLIDKTGAKVYMPDYRVAPENKYPSALEDSINCWNWMLENEGVKEEKTIFIGDSAGGNLTLVTMLKLRDDGRKLPAAAVLISPWGDMTASGKSYVENYMIDVMFGEKGKEFEEEKRQKMLESDIFAFVGDNDRTNPYISPIFGDYTGFPSMLFVTAKNEMLLADTQAIAERLKQAGSDATVFVKHNMFHVYPLAFKIAPEAKEAAESIVGYMCAKF